MNTVHAPFLPALDLKPLMIINADLFEEFPCLLYKLSLVLTALDYKQ